MNSSENGEILPISMDDLDTFVEMHARFINYGDGVRPYYEKEFEDSDTVGYKYVEDGKTVGMILFAKGICLSGEHEEIKQKILSIVADASIYTGEAFFVLPEYRNHKIGVELLAAVKNKLREKKVMYSMRELWIHPDGRIPADFSKGMLGECIDVGTFPMFYKDFYKYGFICSKCGKNCHCSAQIVIDCILSEGEKR